MSFFDKLKEKFSKKPDGQQYLSGFQKTTNHLSSKLNEVSKTFTTVTPEFLEVLMITLLESDVGIKTAEKITTKLENKCNEYYRVSYNEVIDFLIEILAETYGEDIDTFKYQEDGPTVILLVGVNGSGKTTSCAKLIKRYQDEGKTVAVVAADTFRAGAIQQLASWADRLNVHCIKGKENGDPSAAIVDGCRYAKENNVDVLICDTAGRLQNKTNLMNELSKMHRVLQKEIPTAPNEVWLVLDSNTGQNGLSQAQVFLEVTNVTGIILTKMDGTAKGGIILAIKDLFNIPVKFIGVGEKPEDLKKFDLDSYLYSIAKGLKDDK